MTSKQLPIQSVPTNVITGFLGAGKTTLIHQLLKNKPPHERWAILVNEFGEIGIDGAFFEGKRQGDVFVREVPGGCMCCASGLPMQIALNQLLAQARPHRLLIEPTGLGHPKEVLSVLTQAHYEDVLDLQSTVTLVDARNLANEKYRTHHTFCEQLVIADVLYASKSDLYSATELNELDDFKADLNIEDTVTLLSTDSQRLIDLMRGPSKYNPSQSTAHHHHHGHDAVTDVKAALATEGQISLRNEGEGFYSHGWAFSSDHLFSLRLVLSTLQTINAERLKAVLITDEGIVGINAVGNEFDYFELDDADESRIELITADKDLADRLPDIIQNAML